ncbi:hypothetical protein D3C72_860620 [compost metagenome]
MTKLKKLSYSTKMAPLKPILHNAKISAYLENDPENFQICDSRAVRKNLRNYSLTPFSGIFPKTPL